MLVNLYNLYNIIYTNLHGTSLINKKICHDLVEGSNKSIHA